MFRTASVLSLFIAAPGFAQVVPAALPIETMRSIEPGVEIRQQGPIHEAFAQPGAETRGKGMAAPQSPPPQIEELPPETRPEGANVRWVPGYWSWDAERKDFTWVSGLWRNVPEGRAWSAGQWKKLDNGEYQYLPGYWRDADESDSRIDLPEPPQSLEAGPNVPNAQPDSIWIPGGWEYQANRYAWRPGYWATPNGGMLWQPGQYVRTGFGYVYVPGYWDYPLEGRGLLFASVGFTRPLWRNAGWRFTPRFAIGIGFGGGWGVGGFYDRLSIGAGWNSYYLGAGFSARASIGFGYGGFATFGYGYGAGAGYRPWFATAPGYANPLWNYYGWANRGNPGWANGVRGSYAARSAGLPISSQSVVHNTTTITNNVTINRTSQATAVAGTTTARTSAPLDPFKTAAPYNNSVVQPVSAVAKSIPKTISSGPIAKETFFQPPAVKPANATMGSSAPDYRYPGNGSKSTSLGSSQGSSPGVTSYTPNYVPPSTPNILSSPSFTPSPSFKPGAPSTATAPPRFINPAPSAPAPRFAPAPTPTPRAAPAPVAPSIKPGQPSGGGVPRGKR